MLSLLFQEPLLFAVWIMALLIALTVHEFSHALVGTLLGDETAKRLGRLTLNPVAHVDGLGLLALVTVGFGWGKPVPYNAYNLRYQKWGPVLVALAGPGMNLLVATVLALVWLLLWPQLSSSNLLIIFLHLLIRFNLILLVFNLLPIPPLDGSKLLLAFLRGRPSAESVRFFLETKGPLVLLGIIIVSLIFNLNLFGWLGRPVDWFMDLFGIPSL